VAHLGVGAIYLFVIGPVFAIFRWRFKKAVRFIPAILFAGVAIYISVGAIGPNARVTEGFGGGGGEFMSLFATYIVCTVVLGLSDFKLTLFGIFPMYIIADIIINIGRVRRFKETLDILPPEYHSLFDSNSVFQQFKVDLISGGLVLFALYLQ